MPTIPKLTPIEKAIIRTKLTINDILKAMCAFANELYIIPFKKKIDCMAPTKLRIERTGIIPFQMLPKASKTNSFETNESPTIAGKVNKAMYFIINR